MKKVFDNCLGGFQNDKLDHIIDNIYLGNWDDSINKKKLQKNNIKCILTLNKEYGHNKKDIAMFNELGIQRKYIEIRDSRTANITPHLYESIQFIKKYKGNILVHCTAGISRSVSVVVYYLMKEKNMSYDDSIYYIRNKRPIASPNPSFVEQLKNTR